MSMDQQQTFSWMVEELKRLRQENERLRALLPDQPAVEEPPSPEQEHMRKMLDEARERVAPLVREALEAENPGRWR